MLTLRIEDNNISKNWYVEKLNSNPGLLLFSLLLCRPIRCWNQFQNWIINEYVFKCIQKEKFIIYDDDFRVIILDENQPILTVERIKSLYLLLKNGTISSTYKDRIHFFCEKYDLSADEIMLTIQKAEGGLPYQLLEMWVDAKKFEIDSAFSKLGIYSPESDEGYDKKYSVEFINLLNDLSAIILNVDCFDFQLPIQYYEYTKLQIINHTIQKSKNILNKYMFYLYDDSRYTIIFTFNKTIIIDPSDQKLSSPSDKKAFYLLNNSKGVFKRINIDTYREYQHFNISKYPSNILLTTLWNDLKSEYIISLSTARSKNKLPASTSEYYDPKKRYCQSCERSHHPKWSSLCELCGWFICSRCGCCCNQRCPDEVSHDNA